MDLTSILRQKLAENETKTDAARGANFADPARAEQLRDNASDMSNGRNAAISADTFLQEEQTAAGWQERGNLATGVPYAASVGETDGRTVAVLAGRERICHATVLRTGTAPDGTRWALLRMPQADVLWSSRRAGEWMTSGSTMRCRLVPEPDEVLPSAGAASDIPWLATSIPAASPQAVAGADEGRERIIGKVRIRPGGSRGRWETLHLLERGQGWFVATGGKESAPRMVP